MPTDTGYSSWQQGRWLYHCGDGCAFLRAVGRADLDIDSFSATGSPTAYLFSCMHCGAHLAYSDFD